ncbi:MAG TPA: response regulator transcription factor [Spirochaetia bacterium]|nr:response regulator transcription factor [Spirochaetia bacterium]
MERGEKTIRVVISAQSPAERGHLAGLLSGHHGIAVVGTVAGAAGAGRAISDLLPDVLVYALAPPDRVDSVERTAIDGPLPPSIFLLDEPPDAVDERRAHSFLRRTVRSEALAAAVRAVAAGLVVGHPELVSRLEEGASRETGEEHGEEGGTNVLTGREREVLAMIAEGLPNKAIATEMGITSHTVKFHVASIMQKLGASSRTEAVTLGLRQGLILL